MKKFTVFVFIGMVITAMTVTGFQCGSSEMTSAKLYMSQKNYEKADTALTKELANNPQNSEAWYLLGRIKLEQGNYEKMVEAFSKSLETGKEFQKDISDAEKYIWQVSINRGASYYNRSAALEREPGTPKKDSIRIYREGAISAYKTALKVNPDSVITYTNLAIAQFALDKYDDEIATLSEGIKQTHTHSLDTIMIDAYRSKLNDYNMKIVAAEAKKDKQTADGFYAQAITTVNEIRKMYPENTDLMAIQTDFYVRSGRAEEAKPAIRESIQKDPTNKINHYNLGVLLLQSDSLHGAIAEFEMALKSDPTYDVALQNAAVTYMKLGDRVRKANQDSKEIDKSYIDDFKKAAGYFEKLTEVKKDDATIWEYLASAYANAGMVKKAEEALKKADTLHKK
jgi:tetratricopeptide (TPR) repeat protein